MNDMAQVFHNSEFGNLEILCENGKFLFPAIECAKKLGYSNPRKAIIDHCKSDGVTFRDGVSSTTNQHGITTEQSVSIKYISEGNLYRLIVRSKLESAQRFEAWVFDEVLPAIRKFGVFATPEKIEEFLYNPDAMIRVFCEIKKERAEKEMLSEKVARLTPKAAYYDLILQNPAAVPVTLIAKDYGMSAVRFNRLLEELGIQFSLHGTWVLYQKYAGNGYTHGNVFTVPGGKQAVHTCWTQKGRLFLYSLLSAEGIHPAIERMENGYAN